MSPTWRQDWGPLYSAKPNITPGHEFLEARNLVVSDAGEHIGELGLRIDAIEFGCFDPSTGDGS